MKARALVVAVLTAASSVSAGGFAVGAQTAEALGQGGAVSARPEVTGAGYYNPSSATDAQGLRVHLGMLVISSAFQLSDRNDVHPPASTISGPSTPPHLFVEYARGKVGFTLFAGVPFGSSVAYDASWHGRYEVTNVGITTFAINPNVVYRPIDRVSLAAGAQLLRTSFDLRRKADLVASDVGVHIFGDGSAISATASATVNVREKLRVAATYRGGARLELDGGVDFSDVPLSFSERIRDQRAQARLNLPDRYTVGAHFSPRPELGLRLDLEYFRWSTFKTLDVYFAETPELDARVERNWRDTLAVRIGGDYRVTEMFTARAGLLFDPAVSPANTLSPSSPDANRLGFSAGVGVTRGNLRIDAGYLYLHMLPRNALGEAMHLRYVGAAHVASVTAGHRFDL